PSLTLATSLCEWSKRATGILLQRCQTCAPPTGRRLQGATRLRLSQFTEPHYACAMRPVLAFRAVYLSLLVGCVSVSAQSPAARNPDVSNKALITKSTPTINDDAF